ncbi:MAG: DUF262 domain-containing protein [Lachnoclostridium sp.]|nr:DUF262 domain-containing protein [Lachnoclostridium sp.]
MDKKTFKEIFRYTDERGVEHNIPIVIPMIQRDYAQGRSSASEIRKSFVKAIHDAVSAGQELNLDFVYGSYEKIDDNVAFIPLDGQQRLTTLFLLHWLVARRENVTEGCDFIERFTYMTRHTTRAFCEFLTRRFTPEFIGSLSHEIKEDPRFILLWKNDPTVEGMLVMLDALNDNFYGENPEAKYWDKLPKISFFFADLDELGISDEIYIKMNSRGKPLTPFEHFKAELDSVVDDADFSEKIDTVWIDVFWDIREEDGRELPVIDDSLLRYIHYIADIICLKESGNDAPADDFEMIEAVYSGKDNQRLLEKALDVWVGLDSDEFFSRWFADNQPAEKSFLVNLHQPVNLLRRLSRGDKLTMPNILLLWGCITYLTHKSTVTEQEFRTRIRVLRNLVYNSENEYRKERYAAMVNETERLILSGSIGLESNSFNQQQKVEEAAKLEWIEANDEEHELHLAFLENNNLLLGSTCLIGTDNYDYFETFNSTFSDSYAEEQWIELSRALLTYGDISYRENRWRVLIPGKDQKIWRDFFGPNTHVNFRQRAGSAISGLLKDINEGDTCAGIVEKWIGNQLDKFDWRYYFIKYPVVILKSQYGKYYFPGDTKGCHFYTMHTALSTGGRHWEGILLALSGEPGWNLGEYGNGLTLEGTKIYLDNDRHSAIFRETIGDDQHQDLETIEIPHDGDSDLVDRVALLRSLLPNYL